MHMARRAVNVNKDMHEVATVDPHRSRIAPPRARAMASATTTCPASSVSLLHPLSSQVSHPQISDDPFDIYYPWFA